MHPAPPALTGAGTSLLAPARPSPPRPAGAAATASPLPGAGAGALVSARVAVGAAAGGTATLELAGRTVDAVTAVAVRSGARLELQVVRTSPVLELRLLDAASPQLRSERAAALLREALPRQQPLSQSLQRLTALAGELQARLAAAGQGAAGIAQGGLPDAATAARLQQLLSAVRTLDQARAGAAEVTDPARLRAQVEASGTFLEAGLAQARLMPGDLKAQLLALRQALQDMLARAPARAAAGAGAGGSGDAGKPGASASGSASAPAANTAAQGTEGAARAGVPAGGTTAAPATLAGATHAAPPAAGQEPGLPARGAAAALDASTVSGLMDAMRQAADAGVARIEVNQAQSARASADSSPVLFVEVPLRNGDGEEEMRLAFRRQRRGEGEDAQHVWSVSVDVEPAGLGRIAVKVALADGRISSALVAERAATHARIDAGLPQLEAALHEAGIQVATLTARRAPLPDLQQPPGPLPALLSVHA